MVFRFAAKPLTVERVDRWIARNMERDMGRAMRRMSALVEGLVGRRTVHGLVSSKVFQSQLSGEWFPLNVRVEVYNEHCRIQYWAESEAVGNTFRCELSCCLYHNSLERVTTVEGDIAYIGNCYEWDDDDGWHSEEEPEYEDCLSGYHSERRIAPTAPYDIGVELEVRYESSRKRGKAVTEMRRGGNVICERDGSLCFNTGVEIVQRRPSPLAKTLEIWADVLQHVPKQTDNGGYGMHININAYRWSDDQRAAFVCFWTMNEDLVRVFAKRSYNNWAGKGFSTSDLKAKYGRDAGQKYLACAIHDNYRLEVRLHKGTSNLSLFRARVQLTDAVARWAKKTPCTMEGITNITGKGGLVEYMTGKTKYAEALERVLKWANKEAETECA